MNSITASEIEKTMYMQRDLILDGEMPVGIKCEAYLVDFYTDCEEMELEFAKVLAKSIVEYSNEYAIQHKYHTGEVKTVGKYTSITIHKPTGEYVCEVCYKTDDYAGLNLVMRGIGEKYPKIMIF